MNKLILPLLMALALTSCAANQSEIYPRTMVVTETNESTDTVVLTDSAGHMWEFYGIEDWIVGDVCSCIMNTNGTKDITDDTIVDMRYNGSAENLANKGN